MASSTSSLLELELMAATENDGTWGVKANTVMQLIENAIAGATSISVTGGFRLLTDTDLVANEARKGTLIVSGTLASNQTVIVPNRSKTYRVRNLTSGAYTLTISTPTTLTISGKSGTFTAGETVTGGTSGATAIVLEETSSTVLTVHTITGSFVSETITGGASSATATWVSTTSPVTTVAITQGSVASIYVDGSGNIFFLTPIASPTAGTPTSTSSGTSAAFVSFTPFGNTTSTNVQDAIVELQSEIDAFGLSGKQDASARLTEVGDASTSLGSILAATGAGWAGLAAGTNGQQLQVDSAQASGVRWVTPEVDGASKTKGTIYASNGSQFVALGVGANNQVLIADSAETTGVRWGVAGVANNAITNAILADVATDTVKGRTLSGSGAPTDLSMSDLATMIAADATAVATLLAALDDFDPADDMRGTTETGTITIPSAWVTYLLFGVSHRPGFNDDGSYVRGEVFGVWRSSVTRSVEATQAVTDYGGSKGFIIAIRVT